MILHKTDDGWTAEGFIGIIKPTGAYTKEITAFGKSDIEALDAYNEKAMAYFGKNGVKDAKSRQARSWGSAENNQLNEG